MSGSARPSAESEPSLPALALTVVCPIYNEHDALIRLRDELVAALEPLPHTWEVLFVDDGSRDGSRDRLRAFCHEDERFKAILLRKNVGKATALDIGFRHATGDVVVTIDGDLQDDPADIPPLIAPIIANDADLAAGWKVDRQDPINKTLPSRLYNAVVRATTGIRLHDMNSGFKAYRQEVLDELVLYGDLHRYIPVMVAAAGYRITEVQTNHRPRPFGESKYTSSRFLRGFLDLWTILFLTRFRRRPLHLFGTLALALGGTGFVTLAYLTVIKLLGEPIGHRPLLLLGVLLVVVATQLFTLGLLGELVTHTAQRRREDNYVHSRLGIDP